MISDGVTIALQLWLIGLTVFVFLGYPPILSIGLGAIAALSGRFITQAVRTAAQTPPPVNTDTKESPLKQARNRLKSWKEQRDQAQLSSASSQKKGGGRKRRRSLPSKQR